MYSLIARWWLGIISSQKQLPIRNCHIGCNENGQVLHSSSIFGFGRYYRRWRAANVAVKCLASFVNSMAFLGCISTAACVVCKDDYQLLTLPFVFVSDRGRICVTISLFPLVDNIWYSCTNLLRIISLIVEFYDLMGV